MTTEKFLIRCGIVSWFFILVIIGMIAGIGLAEFDLGFSYQIVVHNIGELFIWLSGIDNYSEFVQTNMIDN